jgi:hypothetical protein
LARRRESEIARCFEHDRYATFLSIMDSYKYLCGKELFQKKLAAGAWRAWLTEVVTPRARIELHAKAFLPGHGVLRGASPLGHFYAGW